MARAPYEEFEHTADLGLRARGGTWEDLLANAGRGMIGLMLDPDSVQALHERTVEADADDAEALVVAWLGEILFALDAERFAPAAVEVDVAEEGRVRGRLRGEPLDESRHHVRNVIKAVTWHDLRIVKTEEGYEATVIFDV